MLKPWTRAHSAAHTLSTTNRPPALLSAVLVYREALRSQEDARATLRACNKEVDAALEALFDAAVAADHSVSNLPL